MGKGSQRERQASDFFGRAGWMTYHPATVRFGENDVFGLFDLLAIEPTQGRVEAVQVKSNRATGIQAYSRQTWPWRACGWRTSYLVPYDRDGWRYIRVDAPGEWSSPVDERNEDCDMGEHVVDFLRRER